MAGSALFCVPTLLSQFPPDNEETTKLNILTDYSNINKQLKQT